MNTKLHAVADAKGRPIGFFMSAGQVITPALRLCWAACRRRVNCWQIGGMMPIGLEKL